MTTTKNKFSNLNFLTFKTLTKGFSNYFVLLVCSIFCFFVFEAIKAIKKTTSNVVLVNFNY